MATVSAYWRPTDMMEALQLLGRPGAVVMGGGTAINARPTDRPVEVVDLQALGLGQIEWVDQDTLRIGATATLRQVVDSPDVPAAIREAARRELPSTLRAQATVAGVVMTPDGDSELVATLLVHDADVALAGPAGDEHIALARLLSDPPVAAGRIVTALTVDGSGVTYAARTGRTPADRPIVAAVGRRSGHGRRKLALTGVAPRPLLCALEVIDQLDPPADFRGSKEYRRALAQTLARRVWEAIS